MFTKTIERIRKDGSYWIITTYAFFGIPLYQKRIWDGK